MVLIAHPLIKSFLRTGLLICLLLAGLTGYAQEQVAADSLTVAEQEEHAKKFIDKAIRKNKKKLKKMAAIQKRMAAKVDKKLASNVLDSLNMLTPIKALPNSNTFLDTLQKINSVLDIKNKALNDDKIKELLKSTQLLSQQEQALQSKMNVLNKSMKGQYNQLNKKYIYAMEKIKYFKSLKEQPHKIEEEAFNFLITKNKNLFNKTSPNSSQGKQTFQSVQHELNTKFGANTYTDWSATLLKSANQVMEQMDTFNLKNIPYKQYLSKYQIKKLNTARFKPLKSRIEPLFNFNISPANKTMHISSKGLLGIGATLQTHEKSKIGVSLNSSVDLGYGIRNIQFKPLTLSLEFFTQYTLPLNFAFQIGYEKNILSKISKTDKPINDNDIWSTHFTSVNNDKAYIGIGRVFNYFQNKKAMILFGYDFLWKHNTQKLNASPWIMKFNIGL